MATRKPPKKPSTKPKPVRNRARKLAVAEQLIQGKPVTQIARDAGVSRSTAHRDASSPEVRQILTLLVSEKLLLLESLLEKVLVAVEDALQAKVLTLTKEGNVIEVGPDHYARLAAAKRFIELTTAGRPLPKAPEPPPEKRTITLAEFEEIVKQYHSANHAGPH